MLRAPVETALAPLRCLAKPLTYEHFQQHRIIHVVTEVLVGLHKGQAEQENIDNASDLQCTEQKACRHWQNIIEWAAYFKCMALNPSSPLFRGTQPDLSLVCY
jgi:hypothetical protein